MQIVCEVDKEGFEALKELKDKYPNTLNKIELVLASGIPLSEYCTYCVFYESEEK